MLGVYVYYEDSLFGFEIDPFLRFDFSARIGLARSSQGAVVVCGGWCGYLHLKLALAAVAGDYKKIFEN